MNETKKGAPQNRSLSFEELLSIFRARALFIIGIPLVVSALVTTAAAFMAPVYRARVTFALSAPPFATERATSSAGGLSSLSQIMGLPLSGADSGSALNLAVLRSRALMREFITSHTKPEIILEGSCVPKSIEEKTKKRDVKDDPVTYLEKAVEKFKNSVILISPSATSGVFDLTIDWCSPDLAANWANAYLSLADNKLRAEAQRSARERLEFLKKQLENSSIKEIRDTIGKLMEREYEKLTFAMSSEQFSFRMIDPPVAAKIKISPKLLSILLISYISMFIIMFIYYIYRKNNI